MRRFFCQKTNGCTAVLTGDDARHIRRVLRMRVGDTLSLCDGDGNAYDAVIVSLDESEVRLSLSAPAPSDAESACRVTLYQCLPKAGKMETIVQKCTELGAFAFVPVVSARCVAVPKGEADYERKLARYRRVALEAAKQARRAVVPEVADFTRIQDIDPARYDLFLIAYEHERMLTLKSALTQAGAVDTLALLIGPEGGFAPEEAEALTERGARSVSLGKRILRTETAGMAMLAQALYEVEA